MISNITEILFSNAENYSKKVAIHHNNSSITYGDLKKQVLEYAYFLRQKGIGKGDKVLILIPMGIPLYVTLLAIFFIGGVAVFLDAWSRQKRLDQALDIIDCKAFIGIPASYLLKLRSSSFRKIPINIFSGFEKKTQKSLQPFDIAKVSKNDTALITFTTGSTGIPKAANRTHGFLLAQHYAISNHFEIQKDDIDLTTLPVFILNNLASGITSIIPDFNPQKPENVSPKKIINQINTLKATTSTGSPFFYEKLANYCLEKGKSPESLKKIFVGGAPVFPDLAKKMIKAFQNTEIKIIYGSTEAEPISSISAEALCKSQKEIIKEGLLVGKPVESIKLKILKYSKDPIIVKSFDEFKTYFLNPEEIGEICVSGEHILKEYYNNKQAQVLNKINVDSEVWHRTGDGGYIDEENNLYLVGRINKKFIYQNNLYYLFPIENLLKSIELVRIATILELNNSLFMAIEPIYYNRNTFIQIVNKIKTLDIPYNKIVFIKSIPRDPRHNSKIDYDKLTLLIQKNYLN